MNYQNINTGEVLAYNEIKLLNKNKSYPRDGVEMLAGEWKLIEKVDKPPYDKYTQGVREIEPIGFKQTWEIYALSGDELNTAKAKKQKDLEKAVQSALDTKSRSVGYESILSACSYAGHMNPFQVEGQAFVEWRSAVWVYCYQELAKIENGDRQTPTIAKFIAELPTYQGV